MYKDAEREIRKGTRKLVDAIIFDLDDFDSFSDMLSEMEIYVASGIPENLKEAVEDADDVIFTELYDIFDEMGMNDGNYYDWKNKKIVLKGDFIEGSTVRVMIYGETVRRKVYYSSEACDLYVKHNGYEWYYSEFEFL